MNWYCVMGRIKTGYNLWEVYEENFLAISKSNAIELWKQSVIVDGLEYDTEFVVYKFITT